MTGMMRLNDKVAIFTGAAQGVGEAVAYAMAKEGAAVVAADLNGEGAAKVGPSPGGGKLVKVWPL